MDATTTQTRSALIFAVGLICSVLVSVLILAFPPKYIQFMAVLVITGVVLAVAFNWPELLVYHVIISSSFTGVGRDITTLEVMGASVTMWGLLWMITMGILCLFLLVRGALRGLRVPRFLWPILAMVAWVGIRWATSARTAFGFKDIMLFGLPPLAALYLAILINEKRDRLIGRVAFLLPLTAFTPVILYWVLTLLDSIEFTRFGPNSILSGRAAALYVLIIMCFGVALVRYGVRRTDRRLGYATIMIAFSIGLFTLSRTAVFLGVLVLLFSRVDPTRHVRLVGVTLLALLVAVGALATIPTLRARLFYQEPETVAEAIQFFNTSGRTAMWPLAFSRAIERPLTGWGPGEARKVVGDKILGEEGSVHPHNEYLQMFHDFGLVGLGLMLFAWFGLLWRNWQRWKWADRASQPETALWSLAACAGIVTLCVYGIVGNAFHYVFATTPVLLYSVIADYLETSARKAIAEVA